MRVAASPKNLTLAHFKAIAQLQNESYKYYFKAFDPEFGVVKEEVVDDDSTLPVDGDRIVAWVFSKTDNQSSLFEHENSQNRIDNESTNESINLPTSKQKRPQPYPRSNNSLYYYDQQYRHEEDSQIIEVQLHLNNYNFLGLTLVGPSDGTSSTDGGIYIGNIAKDSVVEQNGRIEIGDKIIEINGLDVRNMRSDDAVATFKSCVDRRGAINLVLQRNTRNNTYNKGRFTLPREYANGLIHQQQYSSPKPPQRSPRGFREEDLPIPIFDFDNTQCTKSTPPPLVPYRMQCSNISRETHSLPRSITPRSLYTTSNFETLPNTSDIRLRVDSRSVYEPSTPTSLRQFESPLHCNRDDIRTVYNALRDDVRSLDIKDREWLKVTVKNAFLGSALVKWLSANLLGFGHRKEVKRYANRMLNEGLIKNPISSGSFSEKCYYTLS